MRLSEANTHRIRTLFKLWRVPSLQRPSKPLPCLCKFASHKATLLHRSVSSHSRVGAFLGPVGLQRAFNITQRLDKALHRFITYRAAP